MAYETKPNSGSLFKNEKKETDQHPDYTGSALIDGTDYWMNAWIKTADTGRKWMSFAFKPKQAPTAAPAPAQQRRQPREDEPPF